MCKYHLLGFNLSLLFSVCTLVHFKSCFLVSDLYIKEYYFCLKVFFMSSVLKRRGKKESTKL